MPLLTPCPSRHAATFADRQVHQDRARDGETAQHDSVTISFLFSDEWLASMAYFVFDCARRRSIGKSGYRVQADAMIFNREKRRITILHFECGQARTYGCSHVGASLDRAPLRIGGHEHATVFDRHQVLRGNILDLAQFVRTNQHRIFREPQHHCLLKLMVLAAIVIFLPGAVISMSAAECKETLSGVNST